MDQIDYPALMRRALRGLIRDVLRQVRDHGVPGRHEIGLVVRTDHPGVDLPDSVRSEYPEDVTIALRPRTFDALEVDDEAFRVTLQFSGVPARVRIPFAALVRLVDPSVQLLLEVGPEAPPPGDDPGDSDDDSSHEDNVVAFAPRRP